MAYVAQYWYRTDTSTKTTFMDTSDPYSSSLAVIDCQIDLGYGEAGECTIKIPPSNILSDSSKIVMYKTWITIKRDGEQVFEGNLRGIEKDFYNCWELTFKEPMDLLNDVYIVPGNYTTENGSTVTTKKFVQNIIYYYNKYCDNSNEKFTWVNPSQGTAEELEKWNGTCPLEEVNTYETAYSRIMDAVESCGGYLVTSGTGSSRQLTVEFPTSTAQTQTIDFGINLLDLTQVKDMDTFATRIIPLGAYVSNDEEGTDSVSERKLDISTAAESARHPKGMPWLQINTSGGVPYYGVITRVVEDENITTVADLVSFGDKELTKAFKHNTQISVSALNLKNANRSAANFVIGELVTVTSSAHGMTEENDFLVTQLSLNPFEPNNEKLVLDGSRLGIIYNANKKNKSIQKDVATLYTNPTNIKKLRDRVDDTDTNVALNKQSYDDLIASFDSKVSTYLNTTTPATVEKTTLTHNDKLVWVPGSASNPYFETHFTVDPNRTACSLDITRTSGSDSITVDIINLDDTTQSVTKVFTSGTKETIDISSWTAPTEDNAVNIKVQYNTSGTPLEENTWYFNTNVTYTAVYEEFQDTALKALNESIGETDAQVNQINSDIEGIHNYLTWQDGKLCILKDSSGIYSEQTNESLKYKVGDTALMELSNKGLIADTVKVDNSLEIRFAATPLVDGEDQWAWRRGVYDTDEEGYHKMNLDLIFIGGSM